MTSSRTLTTISLTLAATLLLAACGPSVGQDPGTEPPQDAAPPTGAEPGGGGGSNADAGNPDQPVRGPVMPVEPADPSAGGALRVQPQPGVVDPRPHAWDHIDVASDGKTLTVYYWGGVEDCYALAGVQVERDDDGLLRVIVFEGQRGDLAPDTACIEIALLKSTVVTLDEPIVAPSQ